MRPCLGANSLGVPPLCRYSELVDGTLTLADVEIFHQTLDTVIKLSVRDNA